MSIVNCFEVPPPVVGEVDLIEIERPMPPRKQKLEPFRKRATENERLVDAQIESGIVPSQPKHVLCFADPSSSV
jgi:hypothetical protein